MAANRWKGVLLLGLSTAALTWAQGKSGPVGLDPALAIKDGSVVQLRAGAHGVQTYTCRPTATDPKQFAYDATKSEPDAVLMDAKGNVIIHHYANFDPAGPAWESNDGSKIVAKKLDPVQPKPGTIPWLLLQVVHREGNGALERITFIHRVDTAGGVAPAGSCDPEKAPKVRVPYKANYYFYGPKY